MERQKNKPESCPFVGQVSSGKRIVNAKTGEELIRQTVAALWSRNSPVPRHFPLCFALPLRELFNWVKLETKFSSPLHSKEHGHWRVGGIKARRAKFTQKVL